LLSEQLECGAVRDTLKGLKFSLSDYIVVCATLAFQKVCPDSDAVLVSIPYTLKDYPRRFDNVFVGNDFASLPYLLDFQSRKARSLSLIKDMLKA
jgi:hypothetical protein